MMTASKSIQFLIKFCLILLPLWSYGQGCPLKKHLAGSEECCKSNEPISCLKGKLKTIDPHKMPYKNKTIAEIHMVKAEYNIQIAIMYYEENRSALALRHNQEAYMQLESARHSPGVLDNVRLGHIEKTIMWLGRKICARVATRENTDVFDCSLFYELDELPQSVPLEQSPETQKEKQNAEQALASTEKAVQKTRSESLLEALRLHIASSPLGASFTKFGKSDKVKLRIAHYLKDGEVIKECALIDSEFRHDCGEKLMGLSNLLHFSDLSEPVIVDITIYVAPSDANDCFYQNNAFYVTYALDQNKKSP